MIQPNCVPEKEYHWYVYIYFITFFIADKIPDDEHFKNGSKDRHNWEADDIDDTNRNDTGMFAYTNGHVKFDTPKVPVIFVLGKHKVAIRTSRSAFSPTFFAYTGGPGSGKVTHCDNLMIEKRGIVHINMTDLLQQYTVGNGKFVL